MFLCQIKVMINYKKHRQKFINMRYKNADITKCPENFIKAMQESQNTKNKGLFIFGDTGTGKTYNLYALRNKYNIPVYNWVEFMFGVKDCFSTGKSVNDYLSPFFEKDLISLDDVGAEKQSEYNQEMLYMIINRFYQGEKRLFIATNLSLKDFQEKYGDRIFSRISEMCTFVEIKGEDKRFT